MMESLNSLKLIVRRKSLLDATCGFSGFYHRQIFEIQSLHFIKKKSILSNIRSQIFSHVELIMVLIPLSLQKKLITKNRVQSAL